MSIILTGDRPTGPMHLGHYKGSLENRLQMQHNHQQFIMIADLQALTDNFDNPQKVTDNVLEVCKDYLAIGIDPLKSTICIQSALPELTELTIYYMNLVTVSRLERNPTVKNEIKQKKYENSVPTGFLCYPISQAADITAFQAELVPVGDDQLPMIELTNEIVRKFNRIYKTSCLRECEAVLSSCSRLPGIDGAAKASKSLDNTIYLRDSAAEIKRKVFSMYTDPNHIKVSDPGKVEGNIVFSYLEAFHSDQEEVNNLKAQYIKGGLGDTTIKALLNDCLWQLLEPIHQKRSEIKNQQVFEILRAGTEEARKVVSKNLDLVRNAMGINYFDFNKLKK